MVISVVLIGAETQMQAQTGTVAKADKAHAGDRETITFGNGDTLTGKIGKVVYGSVSFRSDELGDLTIAVTKIKTMHTATAFAVGLKTQQLTKKNVAEQLPVGKVALENETLKVNADSMPNFGSRYRAGQRISTGFVESAVNEIIAKRMVKKQQMRWNRHTVQNFLDVRIHVLNGTLEDVFRHRHKAFRPIAETSQLAASP